MGTFCPTCQLGGSAPPRELSSQVLVVKCHRYLCWATATAVLGALTSLGWEQNLRGDRPSRQRGADCRVARKWRVTLSRRFVWKLGEGWGHGWIRDRRRHGGAAPAPGPHRAQSRLPVPEGPSPSPSPGKRKPSLKVAWNLLLEGPGVHDGASSSSSGPRDPVPPHPQLQTGLRPESTWLCNRWWRREKQLPCPADTVTAAQRVGC